MKMNTMGGLQANISSVSISSGSGSGGTGTGNNFTEDNGTDIGMRKCANAAVMASSGCGMFSVDDGVRGGG